MILIGLDAIRKHYGVCEKTVRRWIKAGAPHGTAAPLYPPRRRRHVKHIAIHVPEFDDWIAKTGIKQEKIVRRTAPKPTPKQVDPTTVRTWLKSLSPERYAELITKVGK